MTHFPSFTWASRENTRAAQTADTNNSSNRHSMVTLEEAYNKANEQLSVFFAYAKVTTWAI